MSLDICFFIDGKELPTKTLEIGDSLCPRCGSQGHIYNSFLPTDGITLELCPLCKKEPQCRISCHLEICNAT